MTEEEKIVKEIKEDFKARADARRNFDIIWQLNLNFLMGNQYCNVGYGGKVEEMERQFFWQEREVFNHIAPIYDLRFAKLTKSKPSIYIVPSTNDERDKQASKVSQKIFNSVKNKLDIDNKINQGIKWSEACGTVFYKLGWNNKAGQVIAKDEKGNEIKGGEIDFSVVSPFEIYPDSNLCENLEDCQSIIHAKAFSTSEVKNMFGVTVQGGKVNTYALDNVALGLGGLGFNSTTPKLIECIKEDSVVVIEKYCKPSNDYPLGRLIIVAGDALIYNGPLPYMFDDGQRSYPFIKQTSFAEPGSFWGTSVVERLIPVQRAYNAVKNRKHEFINRLSLGVLSVEDGSVDLDNLEDEGLCPGKVIVYRQGSTEPKYLQSEAIPNGIEKEEANLLDEFKSISGVNDLVSASSISTQISGVALELLISQDETRLNASIESINKSYINIAKKILQLYKQFASLPRLARVIGENGQIEMFYFNSNDISSDDVQVESQTDGLQTLTQRRELILELLDKGILNDEEGKLSNKMKCKVLEMLGMGVWENAQDVNELHIKKADNENLNLLHGENVKASEIDNHELHLNEHIAFMLGQDYQKILEKDASIEEKFLNHVKEHKKLLKMEEENGRE